MNFNIPATACILKFMSKTDFMLKSEAWKKIDNLGPDCIHFFPSDDSVVTYWWKYVH